METLQTIIRNLVIILLLAAFLEMLLPNKSMRGFVQLVMGLFVISAVLTPVTEFLHMPMSMEVPAWSEGTAHDYPVLATDKQSEEIGRKAVEEQYRQILVNQIKALAVGVKGVKDAEVEITFAIGSGGVTNQPEISQVDVGLFLTATKIQPVEPVIIGKIEKATLKQTPLTEEVTERITTLMGLPKDKVIVQEM